MTKPNSTLQAGGDETPVAWIEAEPNAARASLVEVMRGLTFSTCWHYQAERPTPRPGNVLFPVFTRPTPAAAAEVPTGYVLVPTIGTRVKANHPITCLNPEETFEVAEVRIDPSGRFAVRGEGTCWFGLSMLASPVAPAGVPTDEREALRELLEAQEALMPPAEAGQRAQDAWVARRETARNKARAVLSAGAPAVPLQDEQDSSFVHLAADGSSRALRAASQDAPLWQPIETAPKDERVLLFVPAFGAWNATTWPGSWSWAREQWAIHSPFANGDKAIFGIDGPHPTHWMPFPEPPTSGGSSPMDAAPVTGSGLSSEAAKPLASNGSNETEGAA